MISAAINEFDKPSANTVREPLSAKAKAATTTTIDQIPMCCGTRTGRGDTGSRLSSSAPRWGRFVPRSSSTATMTTSGTISRTPLRRNAGNQLLVVWNSNNDCAAPSARPPQVATMIERIPPRSAAPSAVRPTAWSPPPTAP